MSVKRTSDWAAHAAENTANTATIFLILIGLLASLLPRQTCGWGKLRNTQHFWTRPQLPSGLKRYSWSRMPHRATFWQVEVAVCPAGFPWQRKNKTLASFGVDC